MNRTTPLCCLAAFAALFAGFGCGGAHEPEERQLWTVSEPPTDDDSPAAVPPSDTAESASRPQLGRGTLMASIDSGLAARPAICITLDEGGEISAIDELSCSVAWEMHECAPDDCPWIRCGTCTLHVERTSDAFSSPTLHAGPPWIVSAHSGDGCAAINGTYRVYADPVCGERNSE